MDEGGMSKNKNIPCLRELFLKGHYDQCLDACSNFESNPDNFFIIENNKLVCESLVSCKDCIMIAFRQVLLSFRSL